MTEELLGLSFQILRLLGLVFVIIYVILSWF